ncbi:MAG: DUF2917 domain-containing protein [Burkholderiales bacterium]|nr:DUF2917 domain-containing protein [Burkholderiales bacterium]
MRVVASALSLQLPRGGTLRLTAARGAQVRAISGRLWLTEENLPEDVFIGAGQHYILRTDALAIIEADHASVLELSGGGLRWPIGTQPHGLSARHWWRALRARPGRVRYLPPQATPSALVA